MSEEARIHVDARGRVFIENASAAIMEAVNSLGWLNRTATMVTIGIGEKRLKPQRAQSSQRNTSRTELPFSVASVPSVATPFSARTDRPPLEA